MRRCPVQIGTVERHFSVGGQKGDPVLCVMQSVSHLWPGVV